MKRIFFGFLALWALTLFLFFALSAHGQEKHLEFQDGKWVSVAAPDYYPYHFTVRLFSYQNNRTCSAQLEDQFHGMYSVSQEGFHCFILSTGDKVDGKVARVHGQDAWMGGKDRVILDLRAQAGKPVGYTLWYETH